MRQDNIMHETEVPLTKSREYEHITNEESINFY